MYIRAASEMMLMYLNPLIYLKVPSGNSIPKATTIAIAIFISIEYTYALLNPTLSAKN